MLQLMEININCGRMGDIEGKWICTKKEWDDFCKKYKGKEICLHDYLGKHSEICISISKNMANVITSDQTFLDMARKLKIDLSSGFNPLDYIDELDEHLEDEEE